MKTNTPSADALMSSIRNQFPRESEEQHRKRFIEMVRNGDWKIREEIVKSLFAVYLNRAIDEQSFWRGNGYRSRNRTRSEYTGWR